MRFTFAMMVACCSVCAQASTIDLDVPGALGQLERSDPARHARVMRLVSAAQRQSCHSDDFRRLQHVVVAKEVDCSMFLRTSYPPQQRLTFALDGAVYTTVVVLHRFAPSPLR